MYLFLGEINSAIQNINQLSKVQVQQYNVPQFV